MHDYMHSAFYYSYLALDSPCYPQSFQNKPVIHQSRASGPERGDHSIEW